MITEYDIRTSIESFVAYNMQKNCRTKWRTPLVAFADAADPEFKKLKRLIGDFYYLPHDLLYGARTVIAYFLPYDKSIIESNIGGTQRSLEWDIAYYDTNNLIEEINIMLKGLIEEAGFHVGMTEATINTEEGEQYPVVSNWSHRHAAWVAGLGTFGLNNMLITKSGCCGRFGTLVTDISIAASRKIKEEYCLYKKGYSCTACAERCHNGCYVKTDSGIIKCDTLICCNFLEHGTTELQGTPGDGQTCGKCLCGLPCSMTVPL